jgi:hypothetical protein
MAGPKSGFRGRLFAAVHAEGAKRGFDHDGLRDLFHTNYGTRSLAQATDAQLLAVYRGWTGKTLKYMGKLPRRAEGQDLQIVSGADLSDLAQEFAVRGLGEEGKAAFIRRQLRGRDVIRTRRDFVRVMAGVRAMNRRDAGKRPTSYAEGGRGVGGEEKAEVTQ